MYFSLHSCATLTVLGFYSVSTDSVCDPFLVWFEKNIIFSVLKQRLWIKQPIVQYLYTKNKTRNPCIERIKN
jgi:hypothetical protein